MWSRRLARTGREEDRSLSRADRGIMLYFLVGCVFDAKVIENWSSTVNERTDVDGGQEHHHFDSSTSTSTDHSSFGKCIT